MGITTRTITIDVTFAGTGRVIGSPGGFAFSGGVVSPELVGKLAFSIHPETPDEEGLWNPVLGGDSYEGGLQVNIWADSEGYRELGRYLLALAELDATVNPGFHEHHEGLCSADGRTRLHIICRKAPQEEWPA